MFLSSLIEELCTKEENKKAGCTLTFGGQCSRVALYKVLCIPLHFLKLLSCVSTHIFVFPVQCES